MGSDDDSPLYVVAITWWQLRGGNYVVAIGAIINLASAILLQSEIIERIVVVW